MRDPYQTQQTRPTLVKLLVVEDDEALSDVIKQGLEEAHYTVDVARDGELGLRMALDNAYAAIVLDVMLPKRDGWGVCQALRARRDSTPILMLTARDAVSDKIRGLEAGADDYLPKPFDFAELIARVRALVRRDAVHKGRVLRVADLELDTKQRTLTRAGQPVALTPREYDLLEALLTREGQTLTREIIMERVWVDEGLPNSVDVYVGMLRRKIDSGRTEKLIHTVHGLGYTLRRPTSGDTDAAQGGT